MGDMLMVTVFLLVLRLLPTSRGNGLETYKWKSIVDAQLPNVSHTCEVSFRSRFNTEATFYDLLYKYPKSRKYMCASLLSYGTDFDECFEIEDLAIRNLLCYEYDVNDDSTPPISKSCAIRYWECGRIEEFFLDLLSKKQQERLCVQSDYFVECMTRIHDLCKLTEPEVCGEISTDRRKHLEEWACTSILQQCYSEEYSAVFQMLLKMKRSAQQLYICGRVEECIVKPDYRSRTYQCSRDEANVLEELLCSNTTFTPDVYGLFLLDDVCRKSFYHCYDDTPFSDLQTDPIKRKTLCQTKSRDRSCDLYFECTWKQQQIIFDFLCYGPNDTMLLVTDVCRLAFLNCFNDDERIIIEVTMLEMFDHEATKQDYCKSFSKNWMCVEDRIGCTENEKVYLETYLCESPSNNDTLSIASWWITGLFLYLALVCSSRVTVTNL